MAETVALKANQRDERGTRKAKGLRASGLIPAVVYGHNEPTQAISVPRDEFEGAIRHGSQILDLQQDGGVQTVQVVDVQWDFLGKEILHADFKRVSRTEKIHVHVPVQVRGIAPGLSEGGILDQPIHSLHIECPAVSIPDAIRVNINELKLGQAIHVRDLALPEEVTALDDPDAVVVHVITPTAEPEAGEEGAEQAEPEVIGRREEAAEEGEE